MITIATWALCCNFWAFSVFCGTCWQHETDKRAQAAELVADEAAESIGGGLK